jgi:Sigma-70 factor, region 1.2/Sigma-70 region 2
MKKSYMAAEDSDTGIKIYLREIGQIPLLTPEQEIELAAKIKKGDREARALMIRSNLRLVVKIAHDYANLGLPLLDLISEGNIGLMKAVDQAVHQACAGEPEQDHPVACASGRQNLQNAPRVAANERRARSRTDR